MLMLLGEAYDKANELHAAHVPDQMTSGNQVLISSHRKLL